MANAINEMQRTKLSAMARACTRKMATGLWMTFLRMTSDTVYHKYINLSMVLPPNY